jgi:hypothetical protein
VTHALNGLRDDEGWPIEHVEHSWLAFMRVEKSNGRQAAEAGR